MSGYPNGQHQGQNHGQYQGQQQGHHPTQNPAQNQEPPNDSYQAHPAQYAGYQAQGDYPQHPLRHPTRFSPSDNTGAGFGYNDNQTMTGMNAAVHNSQSPSGHGTQYSQYPPAGNQSSLPIRSSSRATPQTSYQPQSNVSPTAQAYNPSHFPQPIAPPLSQYHPQSYQPSPPTTYNTAAYQAYNPAAYSAGGAPTSQYYVPQNASDSPNLSYNPGQASPPPPPPRHQGQSFSDHYQDNHYAQQSNAAFSSNPALPNQSISPYSPQAPQGSGYDSYAPNYSQAAQPRYSHGTQPNERSDVSASHSPQTEHLERHSSLASRVSYGSNPQISPQISTPSPGQSQPPAVGPHRAGTIGRHPQYRPLPGPPSESSGEQDYFGTQNGAPTGYQRQQEPAGYQDLIGEVDAAIYQGGRTGVRSSRRSPQSFSPHETIAESREQLPGASPSPQLPVTPDERPTHVNGGFASTGDQYINYAAFSDESDAEAAAGVEAMRAAEAQEAAEVSRRESGTSGLFNTHGSQRESRAERHQQDIISDSDDYANVDMGFIGGGYGARVSYGGEPPSEYPAVPSIAQPTQAGHPNPRLDSLRSSGPSSDSRGSPTGSSPYDVIPGQDSIHPFPPFRAGDLARVDTGGTGGLTEPSPHPRRLSFDDGDEGPLDYEAAQHSGSVSPSKDGMPDLFFSAPFNTQRPLPPHPSVSDPGRIPHLIPAGTFPTNQGARYDGTGRPIPLGPSSYAPAYLSPSQVPRSSSLAGPRSTPRADQPIRSKTDADRARILRQQQQQLGDRSVSEVYEPTGPGGSNVIDLPPLPRKKFNPAKLTKDQFRKCVEPWGLSAIVGWVRDLADEETDLKEQAVTQAIIALFTFSVPTMNTTDAETLGDRVVKEMFSAGALLKEEEWVKFGQATVSGVLFQLTKKGCYSPRLHEPETRGKCYSYHCMRTLRKVDLSLPAESEKTSEDWATFHKITKAQLGNRDKKEIERQNVLHEIVSTEMSYIASLEIVRILYRDSLLQAQPPVLPSKRVASFCRDVFGHIDRVKKVNEDFLLAQLKYRQREQGPWIVGFSDIFREWIRKAKSIYVEYAAGFPHANFLVRKEAARNMVFRQFLDQARDNKRSNRLSWDTYLKSPITRLQRYDLLLKTVLKVQIKDSDEKFQLQYAIDEIKAATFECDAKVAEMEKKIELLELKDKLRLRPGMEKDVELNLEHPHGHELIIRGDLLRTGGKGLQWVDTHAILFDHYLVLAKTTLGRETAGGAKFEYYDVSKVPIPMDLVVLESSNDEPIKKGSGMSAINVPGRGPADARLTRTTTAMSGNSAPTAVMGSGGSSKDSGSMNKTMITTTVLEAASKDRTLYPFRVKHLGRSEVYTLFASSATQRTEWCEAIISAKHNHAASLHAQNAEPFRLRALADAAFAYDSLTPVHRQTMIKGTPLDRAIDEVEKSYEGQPRPTPVCRVAVNCATAFCHPPDRRMCAIGTDFGVFFSEYDNPRGWTRAIQMNRVTQVAVFEEFNLFLLISDKSLIAFHLDAICPPSAGAPLPPSDASGRKAPQRLSGAKDVGFFVTGRMSDRSLVFYKKKDGMTSTFKVLEPVLQKSTTARSRFRRGQTEFFRAFDEFYIPTECYGINLFTSSLAVSTARGVEVLSLKTKRPSSVPNLQSDSAETQTHLSSIASRIRDLKPLGMFRLSDAEFLIAYEECAVYVNKHGDISRGVVMEFVGKATSACLYGQHLILFDNDFVEIRNALNGRMKQVIAGKDIKMLDDGGGSNSVRPTNGGLGGGMNGLGLHGYGAAPRTVKLSMQHPSHDRGVVVMELIENEERRE